MMTTKKVKKMFEHENKVYIVAGIHPKNGPVLCDTGHRLTLQEATMWAKRLNAIRVLNVDRLHGIIKFVAYNTTAVTMRPPYAIDMEAEWNYCLDWEEVA